MVSNADKGFLRLARAFTRAVPGARVRFDRLIITTTRTGSMEELDNFTRNHRSSILSMAADHEKEEEDEEGEEELTNCNLVDCDFNYSLELHTGTSWFLGCLEPKLRAFWPAAAVDAPAAGTAW